MLVEELRSAAGSPALRVLLVMTVDVEVVTARRDCARLLVGRVGTGRGTVRGGDGRASPRPRASRIFDLDLCRVGERSTAMTVELRMMLYDWMREVEG